MATEQKREEDAGVVSRLAGRGEEALTRLMDELGRNSRVTDALARAMSAKGKLDDASRAALGQIGLAAADEIKDLRGQLERLEKRLAKLEGRPPESAASGAEEGEETGGETPTAKRSETKKTPTAAKSTKRTPPSTDAAEEPPSPSPGRSIGGGVARGTSASRGKS